MFALIFAGFFAPFFVQAQTPAYAGNFEKKKTAERLRHQNRQMAIDKAAQDEITQIQRRYRGCQTDDCRDNREKEILAVNKKRREDLAEEEERYYKNMERLEQGVNIEDAEYNFQLEATEERQRQESLKTGIGYEEKNNPNQLYKQTPKAGVPVTPPPPRTGGVNTQVPAPQPPSDFIRTDVWVGNEKIRFVRDDQTVWTLDYDVTLKDNVYRSRIDYAAQNGGTSVTSKQVVGTNPVVTRVEGTRRGPGSLYVERVWVKAYGTRTTRQNEVSVSVRRTIPVRQVTDGRF